MTETSSYRYITPAQLARIVRLKEMAQQGATRDEALAASELSFSGFKTLLRRFTGLESWPARFPDWIFDLPVRETGSGIIKPPAFSHYVQGDLIGDLQARVARDQAARRATRERWLDLERERYHLPRRGRMIDEMVA